MKIYTNEYNARPDVADGIVPGLGNGANDNFKGVATLYGSCTFSYRSEEAGFNAHLVKPVDLAALQAMLARGATLQVGEPCRS